MSTTRYNTKMPTIALGPQIGARDRKRLSPPETPTAYLHTERDDHLLIGLARFRLMTTEQAARWDGGSIRGVRTRLHHLWSHHKIATPIQQAAYQASHYYHGCAPRVFRITKIGARHLAERGVEFVHRLDFRDGATSQLPHALATTAFMLELHREVRACGIAIVDHDELLPGMPDVTQTSRRPFRLTATVTDRDETKLRGTVPDRLFTLNIGDDLRLPFALEIDTGSESIHVARLGGKGSIRSKHAIYHGAFLQRRFTAVWGFQRLRVLTVTTSDARINKMIASQDITTGGQARDMFLYSSPERIAQHGILGPAWKSAAADHLSILPTQYVRA